MGRGLGERTVTAKLFGELLDSLDDMWTTVYHPVGVAWAGGSAPGYLESQERRLERLRQIALKSLKDREYIRLRKQGDAILFKLTEKGIVEALKRSVINGTELLDGNQFCYVSFDVPHRLDDVRNAVRGLLRRAGFTMVHYSLWFSSRDVVDDLVCLINYFDADEWVHVFVGTPKSRLARVDRSKRMKRAKKRAP